MNIATTDTSLSNVNNHIMRILELGLGAVLNGNILDGLQNE